MSKRKPNIDDETKMIFGKKELTIKEVRRFSIAYYAIGVTVSIIALFNMPSKVWLLIVGLFIVLMGFTTQKEIKKALDGKDSENISTVNDRDDEPIKAITSKPIQGTNSQPVYLTKKGQEKAQAKERIAKNKEQGIACCPKCGSTSLSAHKKGFGVGKAVVGASLTCGIGLVAGNIGAKKVRITCLNCGHQFFPG